jgi:DNA helicase-2/ATP-dependent DNA helicase PcrA
MMTGTDDPLLADLNPPQLEAVTHGDGPLLILAGPGSGKTRVITRRVAYLLRQGVKPYHLLAITFTNKAAGEMRKRIDELVPGNRVWISTFHSMGARLLRMYAERLGLDRNFTIYDQNDRNRLVKSALEDSGIDTVRITPERIEAAISKAKNQLIGPAKYAEKADDFFAQTVARVYPVYEKKLRTANALDFDDLLFWPALALKNDLELRAELDARFRYVLIDEYQDTNLAQYAIARGLSVDYPNLCVVGDPNQSIYKFRGSDIKNILNFERDFSQAKVIGLDINYRSTNAILQTANTLIRQHPGRHLDLRTGNPRGKPVGVLTFETSLDEAEGIAQRIAAAVKEGQRAFRDFAIFLRTNALSRGLEQAFVKHRLPYQIVKGLAFFDRKENRDVLAYLRLLVNPRDDLSFLRAVNEPPRGVGKISLEHLRQYAEPRDLPLLDAAAVVDRIPAIKGKAAKGLQEFTGLMRDLAGFRDAQPDEVIRQVLDRSGYRAMLANSTDPDDQDRLANIEELITAAKQFADEDSDYTIADFLENITLASDVDGWDEVQDCVAIMTLHSSKGLEFPVVYMVAVEQGLLPHERSLAKEEDVEEERRLAFVGMTRAREELYLCHSRLREFRGQSLYAVPSMFLDELAGEDVEEIDLSASAAGRPPVIDFWRGGGPAAARQGWVDAGFMPRSPVPSLPREPNAAANGTIYEEGMHVRHATYGAGRVTEVSGYGVLRKIKVRFSAAGERTFLADKARLEVVRGNT